MTITKQWIAGCWLLLAAALGASDVQAQTSYPDSVNGAQIPSVVQKCLNSSGQAVPVSSGTCANGSQVTVQSDYANSPISSVTRIANTTTYTANTGWCLLTSSCVTVFSWTGICRANGGNSLLTNIGIYSSANPTLKLSGVLWLFNTTPGTVISDDATFNVAATDFANLVGGSLNGIPFTLATSQASGATNSGVSLTGINAQVQCAAGATTLYGMVEVTNAYIPASGEVLSVRLHAIGLN